MCKLFRLCDMNKPSNILAAVSQVSQRLSISRARIIVARAIELVPFCVLTRLL